jgi:hypothetical protein
MLVMLLDASVYLYKKTMGHTMSNKSTPKKLNDSSDFTNIRENRFLYIDKTKYLHQLINEHTHVFCVRPRRFGKTLMLSTIEAIFAGDRKLFDGLDIASHLTEQRFQPHPVIRLNMHQLSLDDGLEVFKKNLSILIDEIGQDFKISVQGEGSSFAFGLLIKKLRKKCGKVVILIDEYDYSLVESMSNVDLQNEVRKTLRSFYMQIKTAEEHVHFTYITGISKFSKVGIFSEFNGLTDISFHSNYAEMFGYTFTEIKKYFGKEISRLAKPLGLGKDEILDRVSEFYDGYSFDGIARVYNPFTIYKFLFYKDFDYYWVQSGRQQFVEQYLHKKNLNWEELHGIPISKRNAREPGEVGLDSSPESVLYQAGYLTLRYNPKSRKYSLEYPHIEVRAAMEVMTINNYFDSLKKADAAYSAMQDSVEEKNYISIITTFNELISSISTSDMESLKGVHSGIKEKFYRGHICSFLRGAEFFVVGEMETNLGKSDVVAKRNGDTLVIEVKYVDTKLDMASMGKSPASAHRSRCREKLRDAVQQLYNKNYAGSFSDPMVMAIVLDESYKGGCISHAAYGNVAYHIHGDPATHTPIGDICDRTTSGRLHGATSSDEPQVIRTA